MRNFSAPCSNREGERPPGGSCGISPQFLQCTHLQLQLRNPYFLYIFPYHHQPRCSGSRPLRTQQRRLAAWWLQRSSSARCLGAVFFRSMPCSGLLLLASCSGLDPLGMELAERTPLLQVRTKKRRVSQMLTASADGDCVMMVMMMMMMIMIMSHRYRYRYLIGISSVSVSRWYRYLIGISSVSVLVSHLYRYRYLSGIGISSVSVSHRYRYLIGIGIGISSVWGHFGPPWVYLGSSLAPSWGQLGVSWGYSGDILGDLGSIFGPILGPYWGHLGTILGHLGAILGPGMSPEIV